MGCQDLREGAEVHVGSRQYTDDAPAPHQFAAGKENWNRRRRTRRFDDQFRRLTERGDRRHDFIFSDRENRDPTAFQDLKSAFADFGDIDSVCAGRRILDADSFPLRQRPISGIGAFRLHADDFYVAAMLQSRDNAGNQAASTDRHKDGIHIGPLLDDFQTDCPLTRDDGIIIIRMDENQISFALDAGGDIERLGEVIAVQDDFRPPIKLCLLDFNVGSGSGHNDCRLDSKEMRGERNSLSMIPGGDAEDSGPRALNEPVRCKVSNLSWTNFPETVEP